MTRLDLDLLRQHHPAVPQERADDLRLNGVIALERRHGPGCALATSVRRANESYSVHWTRSPTGARATLDDRRCTEEGAEAVALELVFAALGWTVRRRVQAGGCADWEMEVAATGDRLLLEIAGTDKGSLSSLLRAKLAQVRESPIDLPGAACVVRFKEPKAIMGET